LPRDVAISVELVRCLTNVRELYQLPPTFERFQRYLDLVRVDTGTQALPLSKLNPMAKEHALAYVEQLLTLGAEDYAFAAASDAASRLDGDDALKVLLVLMDDAKGGWTNRAFSEFAHQCENKYEVAHGWAIVAVWTAEEPAAELLRMRAFESVYRTVDERRNGPVRTLRQILDREGRTMRFAGHERRYDDATLRLIRERIEPHLDSHAAPIVMAALYGDVIAESLGYPPLGVPDRGGYELALVDALESEKGLKRVARGGT
jgi:hypothetical protein